MNGSAPQVARHALDVVTAVIPLLPAATLSAVIPHFAAVSQRALKQVYRFTSICTYLYLSTHIDLYLSIICVCVCGCMCVCVNAYLQNVYFIKNQVYISISMFTYLYLYTHIYLYLSIIYVWVWMYVNACYNVCIYYLSII